MRAGCLRLVLIFSALLVVTAAAAPSGEQGRTWASIAKLPDWSGPWEPHRNAEGGNQRDALPPLVLTPRYDARLKDLLARQAKTHDTQSNTKLCIPSGLPNLMMRITRLYEFLYAPGEVVIHSQTNETRLVYTDGRTHRANFTPSFAGDSVGHWDGGALVIDTDRKSTRLNSSHT